MFNLGNVGNFFINLKDSTKLPYLKLMYYGYPAPGVYIRDGFVLVVRLEWDLRLGCK